MVQFENKYPYIITTCTLIPFRDFLDRFHEEFDSSGKKLVTILSFSVRHNTTAQGILFDTA